MSWSALMLAFLISHVVGDVLLQTEWQALMKVPGLGDPVARGALGRHIATYMLAFVPALVWIGRDASAARAVGVGALVAIPQLLIDDGHLMCAWLRGVKHAPHPARALSIAVDQSLHVVCLLGAALLAAS